MQYGRTEKYARYEPKGGVVCLCGLSERFEMPSVGDRTRCGQERIKDAGTVGSLR